MSINCPLSIVSRKIYFERTEQANATSFSQNLKAFDMKRDLNFIESETTARLIIKDESNSFNIIICHSMDALINPCKKKQD
jgi:hypothetical protein